MTSEGQVDLFVDMRPLDTLRVAQSSFSKVVKERSSLTTVLGLFNTRKADSLWHDLRLRQAVNYAINREDFLRYAAKGNGVLVPALRPPGTMALTPRCHHTPLTRPRRGGYSGGRPCRGAVPDAHRPGRA